MFGDLTPSWVRLSGGKNAAKNDWLLTWRARAEKMRKIVPKHRFVLHVVLSKHCKYHCFWLFALRTGSENMKKTVVFAVHLKPLVEKTSQNTVFSTRSLKNTVNSDVFGRFSSLTLPKRGKYQCFFFYKHKHRAKYNVFGRFYITWNIWPGTTTTTTTRRRRRRRKRRRRRRTYDTL